MPAHRPAKRVSLLLLTTTLLTTWGGVLPLSIIEVKQAEAATRLGLHVTQEELNIWRQRAASGPYKNVGDVSANSPGDWSRVVSNKESFRSNSSQGLWAGSSAWTVGTCVTNTQMFNAAFPGQGNRTFGDQLRDAAFFAMVLPNDPSAADAAAKARAALLTQAQYAKTKWQDKTTFCEGVVTGDDAPRFELAHWLTKLGLQALSPENLR